MTGFMFQDCGEYTYVEEVVKKTENKVRGTSAMSKGYGGCMSSLLSGVEE